jgi:phosphoribosylaminoimidazole carboxylase (NCAIR synthetase)
MARAPAIRALDHRRLRTSQFEQLVRAICGLPLGPVGVLGLAHGGLIGPRGVGPFLASTAGCIYGKGDPAGRKMGQYIAAV